jgi:hypothetical protein
VGHPHFEGPCTQARIFSGQYGADFLWIITRGFYYNQKYTRNPKEGSCGLEAAVDLNRGQLVVHKSASEKEIRESGDSSPFYNSILRLHSTTPFYNSILQLHSTTPFYNSILQLHSTTPFYNSALQLQQPDKNNSIR